MTLPFLDEIQTAFPGSSLAAVKVSGEGDLPSWFDVTGLACATIGVAGAELARLVAGNEASPAEASVDRRLASFWFGTTVRPEGWKRPPSWDPIAGDYRAKDGWIRLHTNAPHHRAAALSVVGDHADRSSLEPAVERWAKAELEQAVVEAGGCAAVMNDLDTWSTHAQGRAVASEPLVHWHHHGECRSSFGKIAPHRPLQGIRVLDLTRVLAGPVAGRFLAAYGADVLRIDPPDWDEPALIPEVTLGKRCARLDLKTAEGRATFEALLARADVLLHGYRRDALERLGYDGEALRRINPSLIDVALNAYGWTGPWSGRRGFDSLVQMSSGIADYGMRMSKADKPTPLPVQAVDMATGYLLAAAVLHALRQSRETNMVQSARLSLARVADMVRGSARADTGPGISPEDSSDLSPTVEATDWGPARRPRFPLTVQGMEANWNYPARKLGSSPASWD